MAIMRFIYSNFRFMKSISNQLMSAKISQICTPINLRYTLDTLQGAISFALDLPTSYSIQGNNHIVSKPILIPYTTWAPKAVVVIS